MKVLNILLIVLVWLAVGILVFGEYYQLAIIFSLVFLLGIVILILSKKVPKLVKILGSLVLGLGALWSVAFNIDNFNATMDSIPVFAQLKTDDDLVKVYEGIGYSYEYKYEYLLDSENDPHLLLTEINTYLFGKIVGSVLIESRLL